MRRFTYKILTLFFYYRERSSRRCSLPTSSTLTNAMHLSPKVCSRTSVAKSNTSLTQRSTFEDRKFASNEKDCFKKAQENMNKTNHLSSSNQSSTALPPHTRSNRYSYCSSTTLNLTNRSQKNVRSSSQPPKNTPKNLESPTRHRRSPGSKTVGSSTSTSPSPSRTSRVHKVTINKNNSCSKDDNAVSRSDTTVSNNNCNSNNNETRVNSVDIILSRSESIVKSENLKHSSIKIDECPSSLNGEINYTSEISSDLKSPCVNNESNTNSVLSDLTIENNNSNALNKSNNNFKDNGSTPNSVLPLSTSSSSSSVLSTSSSSSSVLDNRLHLSSSSSVSKNLVTPSSSAGCIPSSINTLSSSASSLTSSSSNVLHEIQESLQESSWANRAASLALSLTRVAPTLPFHSLRRSMSPPPISPIQSAPHSPHLSRSRNSLCSQLQLNPLHHQVPTSAHSTPSSPLLSQPRHSVCLPLDSSLPYLPMSPGHSRAPSPIMSGAISPRRHSSPIHSLPTSPTLRPRSRHRSR